MTNDAQNALRRIMEKFTENVRFCLIGNYLSKIIPALQSRSFKPEMEFLNINLTKDSSLLLHAVWRIRDVYPGSRILIFTHPGSRISDPGSKNR
jgi:hypothetical protein